MTFSFILPHLLHNGGVRRFIELGNELIELGHPVTIYVPKNCRKDWEWNNCNVNIVEKWAGIEGDIVITGDTSDLRCLKQLDQSTAKLKFIYVIVGGDYHAVYKSYYGKYPFILNNRVFAKYYPDSYLIEGGVSNFWTPSRKLKIGYQGRKDFGVTDTLKNFEYLELFPVKGKNDDELREFYRSMDYIVLWEKREGWGNTAIEALACGTPVITNGVNVEPFANRCIIVNDLKEFFTPVQDKFSYTQNARKLIKAIENESISNGIKIYG